MSAFDRYLHAIIMRAQQEAREDSATAVEAHHLLVAIAAEPAPTTRELLASVGLDRDAVRHALRREFEHSLSVVGVSRAAHDLPRSTGLPVHLPIGTSAKLAMQRGFVERKRTWGRPTCSSACCRPRSAPCPARWRSPASTGTS